MCVCVCVCVCVFVCGADCMCVQSAAATSPFFSPSCSCYLVQLTSPHFCRKLFQYSYCTRGWAFLLGRSVSCGRLRKRSLDKAFRRTSKSYTHTHTNKQTNKQTNTHIIVNDEDNACNETHIYSHHPDYLARSHTLEMTARGRHHVTRHITTRTEH